ncbi:precorrin-6y C5,15-methyltransferase (decarboxylating) subunit CbiE [Candidatus Bathyarchaeota archaeon A05DMB-2]|nr:precorrin-6y C5,15-methyltransferase (decarboxylating) subunit CbiE [Candidatus Bathyarchaeota archaeon A05DMB-2]
MAKLSIVGTGPGSPDYVTPAARKTVKDAQIVIGAERSLILFREDIKGESLTLTAKNLDDALNYAVDSAKAGKSVAVLSTGDPGFSGLLGSVLKRTNSRHVEIAVIPGVSSVQACAAALQMCWDEVSLFSFHDVASSEKRIALAKAVKAGKDVVLIPNPKVFTPRMISSFLLKNGADKATPVVICENITLSDERIVQTTLENAAQQDFEPMCVMVIKSSSKMKMRD